MNNQLSIIISSLYFFHIESVGERNKKNVVVVGRFGVKDRNLERQMVDFAKRMEMVVVNTFPKKGGAPGDLREWRQKHIM